MKNVSRLLEEQQLLLEYPWYATADKDEPIDLGFEKLSKTPEKLYNVMYRFMKFDQELVTKPHEKTYKVKYSDLNDFGKRDLTTIMKRVIRQITPEEKKRQIEIATKNKDKKSIIVKKVKE